MRKGKVFAPRTQKQEHYYNNTIGFTPKEVLTEEDQELLKEDELPELTYPPFRTKAFKKVAEGKTNIGVGLNKEGIHVAIIHKALFDLGYNVAENSSVYTYETMQEMKSFQAVNNILQLGYLNAETLWVLNSLIQLHANQIDTSELTERSYYQTDLAIITQYYPELLPFVKMDGQQISAAPLFTQPLESNTISKEHISDYVDTASPLYITEQLDNGWVSIVTEYGARGFLPTQLLTNDVQLEAAVITLKPLAYKALLQLIEDDTLLKNLDEDRMIGLIRALNPAGQERFLNDETLQQKVQSYLNEEEMVRALQSFEELPLATLDRLFKDSDSYEVPYILYRNLLLKSDEGKKRALYYSNWFKADDMVPLNELTKERAALIVKDEDSWLFSKELRIDRTGEQKDTNYLQDQLFVGGLSDSGFEFTPEETEAMVYLLRFNYQIIPIMRSAYDGSVWRRPSAIADGHIEKHGFSPAKVGQSQRTFLAGFRRNTLRLALETLDVSESTIQQQYQSVLGGEIQQMKTVFQNNKHLYERAKSYKSVQRIMDGGRSVQEEKNFRKTIAQAYPIFYDENIDVLDFYETLIIKNDNSKSEEILKTLFDEKLENIDETRVNLLSDEDLLWKLEGLINLAKEQFIPFESEELNAVVNRKVSDEALEDVVVVAAIAALSIGLAMATFGASTPITAGLLSTASFGVGTIDAKIAHDEYTTFNAASNTAIDPNLKLTNKAPWAGWVVLSIVGVVLDAVAVAKAIKIVNSLDAVTDVSKNTFRGQLIESASKEGVTLSDDVFERLAAMHGFKRRMIENFIASTDQLKKMSLKAFEKELHKFMINHPELVYRYSDEGTIVMDEFFENIGHILSFSGTARRTAQSRLLHKSFGSSHTIDQLKLAEEHLRRIQDLGPIFKMGVDNLYLEMYLLAKAGKVHKVALLIKHFNNIAPLLTAKNAYLAPMFKSAVLKAADFTAIQTFKGITRLHKVKALELEHLKIITEKIAKGQLNKTSFNWIVKYVDKLDTEALKLLQDRLPKKGINRYFRNIISQMDEGKDVSTVVRTLLQPVSRFEKARDILNKKGYRALARIAEEGLDYFTLVNKQMKDFIKAAPEDEFVAFLNQYRRGGEPGAEFMPLYKNFGEGMERLRKLGPDGKITNKMLQEVMKDMRRHHMVMSNVLKDNLVFQRIMQWALTRVPPKKIGFNDFRKNIIILHDFQHGFHPTASKLMNDKVDDLNRIFNQTEQKINDLERLINNQNSESFEEAYEALIKILKEEKLSIVKNVIQKVDGHLDTKHL